MTTTESTKEQHLHATPATSVNEMLLTGEEQLFLHPPKRKGVFENLALNGFVCCDPYASQRDKANAKDRGLIVDGPPCADTASLDPEEEEEDDLSSASTGADQVAAPRSIGVLDEETQDEAEEELVPTKKPVVLEEKKKFSDARNLKKLGVVFVLFFVLLFGISSSFSNITKQKQQREQLQVFHQQELRQIEQQGQEGLIVPPRRFKWRGIGRMVVSSEELNQRRGGGRIGHVLKPVLHRVNDKIHNIVWVDKVQWKAVGKNLNNWKQDKFQKIGCAWKRLVKRSRKNKEKETSTPSPRSKQGSASGVEPSS